MQAIETKCLPATNARGSRIKAECRRGSITISYPYKFDAENAHIYAVNQLVNKFEAEDVEKYGTQKDISPWLLPFVTGQLQNGHYVHVFITQNSK